MLKNWRLKIDLVSPLAVAPPHLDALLMWELANRLGLNSGGKKLTKSEAVPRDTGCEKLPLAKRTIEGTNVFCCSAPIYRTAYECHERMAKRFECDKMALLLDESARKSLLIASGPYKMRFAPVRAMLIPEVVYFFRGDKKEVRKLLKKVTAIGKHRSIGYGVVGGMSYQEVDEDWSIFAGDVLMRPIPVVTTRKVEGSRRSYGACCPPYWHPDNYMEILEPC